MYACERKPGSNPDYDSGVSGPCERGVGGVNCVRQTTAEGDHIMNMIHL